MNLLEAETLIELQKMLEPEIRDSLTMMENHQKEENYSQAFYYQGKAQGLLAFMRKLNKLSGEILGETE